ncbi:MAG: 3-deoxy-manno-octulosonate cytidylyltransferase [candidate division Zixibacteria bacterium]|nr:3-deoxy-manno-octulosonate cytidylyltransferase [candidate division Zixibacteria bacterium]MDD5427163.1 3-deoxy-manno-octulosonate cytidylyltransferase [candidate division Zixibacteria bacterium]
MKKKVVAVIPARLSSRRFSGKVLYPYHGKPLLYYVWNEVAKARTIDRLLIATDQPEIVQTARSFGAEVCLTAKRHKTGSDRVAEVMTKTGGDIVINIQADNFGLTGALLDRVVGMMIRDQKIRFATLAFEVKDEGSVTDFNLVKLVMNKHSEALWFSRYPLPYKRGFDDRTQAGKVKYYGHIGVYFFTRDALCTFAHWRRTPCEKAESLEQLRILENGEKMKVFLTRIPIVSVDCKRDLKKLEHIYK